MGTDEKAKLAREADADDVIVYTRQDFEAETKRLTDGKGVHVIYDGVGKTTFDKDLNVLRPRAYLVLFGASSGPVAPFDPILLSQKGSIFLTRPTLGHYAASREDLELRSREVCEQISKGKLKLRIGHVYKLSEAAQVKQAGLVRARMGLPESLLRDSRVRVRRTELPAPGRAGGRRTARVSSSPPREPARYFGAACRWS